MEPTEVNKKEIEAVFRKIVNILLPGQEYEITWIPIKYEKIVIADPFNELTCKACGAVVDNIIDQLAHKCGE